MAGRTRWYDPLVIALMRLCGWRPPAIDAIDHTWRTSPLPPDRRRRRRARSAHGWVMPLLTLETTETTRRVSRPRASVQRWVTIKGHAVRIGGQRKRR